MGVVSTESFREVLLSSQYKTLCVAFDPEVKDSISKDNVCVSGSFVKTLQKTDSGGCSTSIKMRAVKLSYNFT